MSEVVEFEEEVSLRNIVRHLLRLGSKVEKIMAQIDDLTAAIAALSTEEDSVLAVLEDLTTELGELESDFKAAQGAGTPVDLTAALASVASIQAKLDTLNTSATAADASVKAALPATPAVTVTSTTTNADGTIGVVYSDGSTATLPAGSDVPADGSAK